MALLKATTYGVVEINKLTSRSTGAVYNQMPLAAAFNSVACENGMLLQRDIVNNEVVFPTENTGVVNGAAVYLVASAEKNYDQNKLGLGDFAVIKKSTSVAYSTIGNNGTAFDQYTYPALYELNVGARFTTNLLDLGATLFTAVAVGHYCVVKNTGLLTYSGAGKPAGTHSVLFRIVEKTTLPNGHAAVKVEVVEMN